MRKVTQHQVIMKFLLTISILTLSLSLFAQDAVTGRYRDYFGSRLTIKADSTFKYTWNFDLSSSWTKGTWSSKGDTVYLQMTPIFDTVSYQKENGVLRDTLILSDDDVSERISNVQSVATALSLGGQNIKAHPEKLVFRKGRLYKVISGKLLTNKQKGILSDKKWNPWFFKSDD